MGNYAIKNKNNKNKSFIYVLMYLVYSTNWGHKTQNYLQIRNLSG